MRVELPMLMTVAFFLAVLVRVFLLQTFLIPSESMERTLLVGDRVLVDKLTYDVREPMRGEVVVFSGSGRWARPEATTRRPNVVTRLGDTLGEMAGRDRPGDVQYIKRVIGVPGDRVSCCDPDGRVVVNGRAVDESYVFENSSLTEQPGRCGARRFPEKTVQTGHLWVMGDHRSRSSDARCSGPVAIADVVGRAIVVLHRQHRVGLLSVPPSWERFDAEHVERTSPCQSPCAEQQ